MTAGLAAAVGRLQVPALAAEPLGNSIALRPADARAGIEPHRFRLVGKPGAVDLVEVRREFGRAARHPAEPAGGVAVGALQQRQIQLAQFPLHIAVSQQFDFLRIALHLRHHPPQFAHPELHPQRHQRTPRRVPRPRHQRQQRVQHRADLPAGSFRQRSLHLLLQIHQRHDLPLQKLEQIDEEQVLFQQPAQCAPPRRIIHFRRTLHAGEKQGEPRGHRLLRRTILVGIQNRRQIRSRIEHVLDRALAQKLHVSQAAFRDHRPWRKFDAEDLPGVFAQRRRVRVPAQGGGSSGVNQPAIRRLQPRLQAAQEQRQIGALSTVEGVQLIHHHIAQRLRRVLAPEMPVLGTDQQVVEHLVIGQQDVGRILAQRGAVGDHARRRHHHLPAAVLARTTAHEQAHPQSVEGRGPRYHLRKAPSLIGGQRVHGINHQRLDAGHAFSDRAGAMLQHGVEETLGLAAARAGGDQSARRPATAGQPLPRRFLMHKSGKLDRKGVEECRALRARPERQAHLNVWPLQPAGFVLGEAPHHAREERIGGLKTRGQKMLQPVLDFARKQ